MSTLSFVALSLQTTHLDPATVSKISYAKLVEGEITRIGSIEVIPPTQHQQHDEHDVAEPTEALPWPEALKNFSMIVGKLPLVSYYRDADKEIFQAANKFYDDTPPNLHWLDGRAVVQHLEPEFEEYQLLSVLQTLNLHKQYATSSTSEQTAQIILALAQQHEIDSTKQLWGELYHQPDDHLELPFTVENGGVVTQPETDEIGVVDAITVPEEASEEPESAAAPADAEEPAKDLPDADSLDKEPTTKETDPDDGDDGGFSEISVSGASGAEQDQEQEQPEFLKVPLPEDLEPASHNELADDGADVPGEDQPAIEETGPTAEAELSEEVSEEPESVAAPAVAEEPTKDLPDAESLDEEPTTKVADPVDPDEELSDAAVSGTSGVEQSQEQEQPEFLKVPLPEDLEPAAHDEVAVETGDDEADVPGEGQPTPEKTTEPRPEPIVEAEHLEQPIQTDEESQNATEDDLLADAEVADEEPVVEVEPVDAESSDVEPDSAEASVQQQPVLTETASKKTSSVVRVFALLGFIVFGLLTVAGVVVTVMAGFQFVVPNTLMLETKIAGVLLTGTLTLLSLLMTTVCYQKFRKKKHPKS